MVTEAIIDDNKVTTSNENGILNERENVPYIEDIIKYENNIETIKNELNTKQEEYSVCKAKVKDIKSIMLELVSIPFLAILTISIATLGGLTTGIWNYINAALLSISAISIVCTPISMIIHKRRKKDLRKNEFALSYLKKKLSKKEKELEEIRAKQKTHEFEINKEKRLIDFTKSKEEYKNTLDKELGIEVYINKDEITSKAYGKHLISK